MMCFVYIFRDRSGAKREATIDADSREAAFAALKSRGISPLSVRDGGSAQRAPMAGSGGAASRHAAAPQAPGIRSGRAVSFVFLAAFVLIAACSLWWCLDGSDAHRPVSVPVERSSSPRSVKEVYHSRHRRDDVVRLPQGTQTKTKTDVAVRPGPEEADVSRSESMEQVEPEAPESVSQTSRIARTAAEELLMLATPSRPGAIVPPLPDLSSANLDASAERSFSHVIVAEAGDDEARLDRKLVLAEQKEEFRTLRDKEGWRFREYVEALRKKAVDDAAYMQEAHKTMNELRNDETVTEEELKQAKEKIDETLVERGLPRLD